MARPTSYRYVYVADLEWCVKIGVSNNLKDRIRKQLSKSRLVKCWEHPSAWEIEKMCGDKWDHRRSHCREHFDATPLAAVRLVQQTMREWEQGARPARGYARKKLLQFQRERRGYSI